MKILGEKYGDIVRVIEILGEKWRYLERNGDIWREIEILGEKWRYWGTTRRREKYNF